LSTAFLPQPRKALKKRNSAFSKVSFETTSKIEVLKNLQYIKHKLRYIISAISALHGSTMAMTGDIALYFLH
jgi:hypothetical protein